jgi:hypothetical protein
MFPDNTWYSHRLILSQYSNVKNKLSHCSIQHGSITTTFDKNFGSIRFPFSKYLVWNKKASSVCRSNKFYNNEIIGAPFIYLDILLKNKKFKIFKNSFFIMAPHASENIDGPFYHEKFSEYAKKKFLGKITICIFYSDLNKKIINIYKKKNIKIFSCGKRNNPKYLFLLYRQLKINENIIITELGSALFYSLFLNKKTYYIDKFSPQVILNNNQRQILKYKKKNNFLFKNLSKSKIVNGKLGKKLADLELGLKYLKSPYEIKNILWPNNVFLNICSYIFKILLWLKWRNKLIS